MPTNEIDYYDGNYRARIRSQFIEKLSKRYPSLGRKELERIARKKGK